jgi:hypothetical protein
VATTDTARIKARIRQFAATARDLGCMTGLSNCSPEVLVVLVEMGGTMHHAQTETEEWDWVECWSVPEFSGLHFWACGPHRPRVDRPLSGDLRGEP